MSENKSKIKNNEPGKDFDLNNFNKEFVFKKELATVENRIKSQEKLDRLTKAANKLKTPLYNLSVAQIIIGIKDSWFGILDDLLAKKFEPKTLTKENRLFFLGLTVVIIAIILYLYNFFLDEEEKDNNDNNVQTIVEKHYIYK